MGLLQFQNRNNMKKRKFYLSENFNHQTNTQPMLLQQLHKNQHQQAKQNARAKTLHKAIKEQIKINQQLSMNLFTSAIKGKRTIIECLESRRAQQDKMHNRTEFLDRKSRREALGLEEADICNHLAKKYQYQSKPELRRKRHEHKKRTSFQVCDAIKGKYHIKGFAAKISHSLGKQRNGIQTLTRIIDVNLFGG